MLSENYTFEVLPLAILPYVSAIAIMLIKQDEKVTFSFNVKKAVKMFLGIYF